MHYEEKVVDGVLMCRSTPDGDWRPVSARVLTERLCAALEGRAHADESLDLVRKHIDEYYAALDRREHGGVAEHRAFEGIQQVLGMHWVQGASRGAVSN